MSQTILFIDLDGTIMVNPFLSAVFPYLEERLAPDLTREFLAEQQIRLKQPNADPVWIMDWDNICETVVRRHGWELPARVCDLVVEYSRPPYISLIDNADHILRQIVSEKRTLIVASMGLSRYQMPVLKALGLADLFDDFLMPDLTGVLKTDARFYARYAGSDALKISVGDHVTDDVLRPQAFGFRTIFKSPHPPVDVQADIVISDLSELPKAIETLEARNLSS